MERLTERVTPLRTWLHLSRRQLLTAAVCLTVFVVVLLGAHVALNSDSMHQLVRDKARAKLEQRLGPVVLGDEVFVSWFGEARVGPLAIPAGRGEPPLVSVDQVRVRASWSGLLHGSVEPARVTLSGLTVRVDERGERLRAFQQRMPERKSEPSASAKPAAESKNPELVVEDARVVVDRVDAARPPLQFGPFDGRAELGRAQGGRQIDVRLHAGAGNARIHGIVEGERGTNLTATADDLPIAQFAPTGGGIEVRSGLLSGKLELTAAPGLDEATAKLEVDLRELVVAGKRIADEPVGPAQAYYTGTVTIDRAQAQLSTDDSKLLLGPNRAEIPFEAKVELRPELRFDIDTRIGPINLQELVGALPVQLAPPHGESHESGAGRLLMAPPHVDGPMRAEVHASGPVRRPDEWTVAVRLDTRALKESARAEEFALREAFVYQPRDSAGTERTLNVGSKNPSYVPLDELPSIVPAAVITSEDGNFFKHDGFDFDEIRDSIATAAEGQRLRGGSTLTQQLVKNLYLSRERTLQRKLREALITLEIEAALPKQRIIEIYLNIIEWGPGVYGIGEAAHYYFGVDARHLTAKQAVFLATIIPNPIKFGGAYLHKGATSKNWDDHMGRLIEKLRERGDLSDDGAAKATSDPVVFRSR